MPIGFMNYRRGTAGYKKMATKVKRKIRAFVAVEPRPTARITQRNIAPVVRSIINRQEETKCAGSVLENGVIHNAQMAVNDLVGLLPFIPQGQTSNTRIGDKIRPTLLKLKGAVSIASVQGNIAAPITVKIFCLQWKGQRDPNPGFAGVPMNSLLDNGGVPSDWDGSTLHSLYRMNSDVFQVLGTRTLKISATTSENHKPQTATYEINIKPPAVLTYATGAPLPSNYAPFFVLGWHFDDATTPSGSTLQVVSTAMTYLYYKDA